MENLIHFSVFHFGFWLLRHGQNSSIFWLTLSVVRCLQKLCHLLLVIQLPLFGEESVSAVFESLKYAVATCRMFALGLFQLLLRFCTLFISPTVGLAAIWPQLEEIAYYFFYPKVNCCLIGGKFSHVI